MTSSSRQPDSPATSTTALCPAAAPAVLCRRQRKCELLPVVGETSVQSSVSPAQPATTIAQEVPASQPRPVGLPACLPATKRCHRRHMPRRASISQSPSTCGSQRSQPAAAAMLAHTRLKQPSTGAINRCDLPAALSTTIISIAQVAVLLRLCLLLVAIRAAEAHWGLAVAALFNVAHAHDAGVHGAGDAIIVLAVQLGEDVHCSKRRGERELQKAEGIRYSSICVPSPFSPTGATLLLRPPTLL